MGETIPELEPTPPGFYEAPDLDSQAARASWPHVSGRTLQDHARRIEKHAGDAAGDHTAQCLVPCELDLRKTCPGLTDWPKARGGPPISAPDLVRVRPGLRAAPPAHVPRLTPPVDRASLPVPTEWGRAEQSPPTADTALAPRCKFAPLPLQ